MKHFTHWILALLAIAAVASFSGAWTTVQDPVKQEKKLTQGQGKKAKGRAEKQAAIKKALPTLKTTLSEAIALAEKESMGKAFAAGLELNEGKASFQVNLIVSDKFTSASVDPETQKVTVMNKKESEGDGKEEKEEEDD